MAAIPNAPTDAHRAVNPTPAEAAAREPPSHPQSTVNNRESILRPAPPSQALRKEAYAATQNALREAAARKDKEPMRQVVTDRNDFPSTPILITNGFTVLTEIPTEIIDADEDTNMEERLPQGAPLLLKSTMSSLAGWNAAPVNHLIATGSTNRVSC
ncbi:hypothetical protein SCP_1900390 [Sparassis crispa]|uniref:Uncharacterized protein n=1 Tax=Sparassis crispa TaxID=139825 RepID=A0A401H743_9APHY|nr:hypothetical protein SCP_1900390 [Sparassis crispa]GBE90190.1 hypothetical protein SCP_1900390 [Sparassis crispa]